MPMISARARLLSATAIACGSVSLSVAGAARADCVKDAADKVVTCTGASTGFSAPPGVDLDVTVEPGASVAPIPGDTATIAFDHNSGIKRLGIGQGASLRGVVRSDRNDGTISVWNQTGLYAGVALGAVGDTGTNFVINQSGGALGASTLTSDGRNAFYNAGGTSGPVSLSGDGVSIVVNAVGSSTSGLMSLEGDGRNIVDNAGDFGSGLAMSGDGMNVVVNRAGATIESTFSVSGDGTNRVFNWGTLTNGYVSDGSAADYFETFGDASRVSTDVNLGGGDDLFFLRGGTLTNNVSLGDGEDVAYIGDPEAENSPGQIAGSVLGGAGDDQVVWTVGTIGGLHMGEGTDIATFEGLTRRTTSGTSRSTVGSMRPTA